jgi:hypothetical protein
VSPYGVFDVAGNVGWVNVGTDADTGTFAVESIRRWWYRMGRATYPGATKPLITADGGGSNGSRLRLWKTELAGSRRGVRPTDHRRPLPARNQQMEPNRAQTVLGDHDELARKTPDQP